MGDRARPGSVLSRCPALADRVSALIIALSSRRAIVGLRWERAGRESLCENQSDT